MWISEEKALRQDFPWYVWDSLAHSAPEIKEKEEAQTM